ENDFPHGRHAGEAVTPAEENRAAEEADGQERDRGADSEDDEDAEDGAEVLATESHRGGNTDRRPGAWAPDEAENEAEDKLPAPAATPCSAETLVDPVHRGSRGRLE